MFEEVLEYGGKVEKERLLSEDGTDCDSGIVSCSGGKEVEKEKHEETVEEECDQGKKLESREDELTFPAAGILSPLSKSVDAVVTLLVSYVLSGPKKKKKTNYIRYNFLPTATGCN